MATHSGLDHNVLESVDHFRRLAAATVGIAIMLQPFDAEAWNAIALQLALPTAEFFERETITLESIINRHNTVLNGLDDLGLAAGYPTRGICRRQSIWAGNEVWLTHDVGGTGVGLFDHLLGLSTRVCGSP